MTFSVLTPRDPFTKTKSPSLTSRVSHSPAAAESMKKGVSVRQSALLLGCESDELGQTSHSYNAIDSRRCRQLATVSMKLLGVGSKLEHFTSYKNLALESRQRLEKCNHCVHSRRIGIVAIVQDRETHREIGATRLVLPLASGRSDYGG